MHIRVGGYSVMGWTGVRIMGGAMIKAWGSEPSLLAVLKRPSWRPPACVNIKYNTKLVLLCILSAGLGPSMRRHGVR